MSRSNRGAASGHSRNSTGINATALLSEAKWHLDRYDRLRASTASRAGVILSANAIIVAGASLLVANYLKDAGIESPLVAGLLSAGIVGELALSSLSVMHAVRALISRRPWRAVFREQVPASLFYNHGDTVRAFQSRDDFAAAFAGQDDGEVLGHALTELWVCIKLHRHRYDSLRAATRMLFHAILVFFCTVMTAIGAAFVAALLS